MEKDYMKSKVGQPLSTMNVKKRLSGAQKKKLKILKKMMITKQTDPNLPVIDKNINDKGLVTEDLLKNSQTHVKKLSGAQKKKLKRLKNKDLVTEDLLKNSQTRVKKLSGAQKKKLKRLKKMMQ